MIQQWVSVLEAASVLGVSPSTVRRRAQRGQLPCRQNGTGRLEILVDMTNQEDERIARALTGGQRRLTPPRPARISPQNSVEAPAPQAAPAPAPLRMRATPRPKPQPAPQPTDDGRWVLDDLEENQALGTPSGTQAQLNPFLQDAGHAQEDDHQALSRFKRMAGASIVLAQKQTDEAAEALAHARFSLNQSRRHVKVLSGVALFFAFCTALNWFSPGDRGPQAANANGSSPMKTSRSSQVQQRAADPAQLGSGTTRELQERLIQQEDDVANLTQAIQQLRRSLQQASSTRTSSAG